MNNEIEKEELYNLMYVDALTFKEIGKIKRINKRKVSALAKEYGFSKNPIAYGRSHYKYEITEEVSKLILDMYLNKEKSIKGISAEIGIPIKRIYSVLNKNKIEIRENSYKSYYKNRIPRKEIPTIKENGYYAYGNGKYEHRLIYEEYIGRKLSKEECVHHIDFNKENNDINNLFLFPNNESHLCYHGFLLVNGYIDPEHFINTEYPKYKGTIYNYDWMYENYISQNKSINEISKETNVSRTAIKGSLDKLGIFSLREPTVNQF